MNQKRRDKIRAVKSRLLNAKQEIESITDDEQDCFDSLPENFQENERGEKMQDAINSLEEASGCIDDAIDKLNAALE